MKRFLWYLSLYTALLYGQEKRLTFLSLPESCTVSVNNILAGTTPCAFTLVDSTADRTISIRIAKNGYRTVTEIIRSSELRDTLAFVLEQNSSIMVMSTPESASVFINNTLYGRTPLTIDTLPATLLSITLVKQQYHPYTMDISTIPGRQIRLSPMLLRHSNTFSLRTQHPGTVITLDGKVVGYGSIDAMEARYGAHTLSVFDPVAEHSAERTFILNANESKRFESQLQQTSYSKGALGIVFPGVNQLSDGEIIRGSILAGASIAGLYYSIRCHGEYTDARDSYASAKKEYDNLSNEAVLLLSRARVIEKHSVMNNAAKKFNTSLIIPVFVWLLNGYNVITSHSLTDSIIELTESQSFSAEPSLLTASMNIRYSINF